MNGTPEPSIESTIGYWRARAEYLEAQLMAIREASNALRSWTFLGTHGRHLAKLLAAIDAAQRPV